MTKWYEVDMNNLKNYCRYRRQMFEDLAAFFKELMAEKKRKGRKKEVSE